MSKFTKRFTITLLCFALAVVLFPWGDLADAISAAKGEVAEQVQGYYEIWDEYQLFWFAEQVNSGNGKINGRLMADITVNAAVLDPDQALLNDDSGLTGWTPIGTSCKTAFKGIFDGNGHTVSGLYCSSANGTELGLIGYNAGTVRNVGILDSYFCGLTGIGSVVGTNVGTVSDCYSAASTNSIPGCSTSGTVKGTYYVGGIVGDHRGEGSVIRHCYNTGTVTGTGDYVGGLIGYNAGAVSDSFNMGTVTGGSNYAGSICGSNFKGTASNCYYLTGCAKNAAGYTQRGMGSQSRDFLRDVAGSTKGVSRSRFTSGELAYLLGAPFGQNIDNCGATLDHPVLSDATIYLVKDCAGNDTYSNSGTDGVHRYNDATGTCTLCGVSCAHRYETVETAPDCTTQGHTSHYCGICGYGYNVIMNAARNGRRVYCVITDAYGNSVRSKTVTLTMRIPLKITQHPTSVKVAGGANAKVTVKAQGEGLTYTWYFAEKGSNTGDIHCTGNDLGGITGENRGGSISSCYNTGKLHGKGRAIGGIAGTDTGTIRKCYYLKGCVAEDHYGIGRNEDIRGWTSGMTQKAFICGKVANLLGVSYGQNIDNGGVNGGLPVFSDANVYHHTKCNGKKAYSNYATYHHQDPATGNCVLCSGNCVHNYYGTVTAPGCTEDGHTTYTCIKCGDSYVRDVVPAFGHSYQDRRTDPTCTENGSLDSVCVTCGDTVTVSVLNASGHVYEESTVAPSCTEEGGQGYVCSSCGHTHIDEPVPPLGHSWAGGSCIRCGNTPTAVTVVRQPTSVQVPKGGTAKVSLEAEGEGLKYQWYIADPDSDRFSYSDAFTTRAYYIPMTERTNGRRVYCVVTDIYGNTVTTEIVTLSMAPALEIIRQPESVEVGDGEQARVSVGVRGHGVTYEWYYADPGSTEFRKTKSFTTKAYYIAMDAEKDGRQVYCVITDKYGDTLQTDTVTLSMHPHVQITRQPESVKAAMGEKAQISFAVKGEGVTYQWYFAKKGSTTFQKTNAFSTRYYYITMNEENDGRQVYCVATDRYGNSVRTDTVTLELQRHVQITKQPEDMTAASDTTVRFRVKATGDGLIYQWYIADPGSTTFRQDPKGTGKTYSVHMTEAKDGCRIYCVITDAYGNALKTVTVTLSME